MLRKLAFVSMLLATAAAYAAPKVGTLGPCTDAAVPDAVKKVLAPQGYHVTLDDGSTVDFWPRTQVSTASKGREDATYSFAPSTLIGVIHFEKGTRDYRGNAISSGTYSLRYELQPSDGNHLGTSPTPDFLLLVPPSNDSEPDTAYTFEELVALSRQVTGKKHPAPLNLVSPEAKEFPSVVTDADEHTILSFKLKSQSGELPVALVIKGTTTE
jgi:hypothetical protein